MGEDKRGKHTPSKETPEEDLHHVRGHIESFPITESHYTRKDTKRKYLDQKLSIAKIEYIPTPCKKKSTVEMVNEYQPGPSQPAPTAVVNEPQPGPSQPAPTAVVKEPQPGPSQPAPTAVVNEPQPGPSQPAPTAVVKEPPPGSRKRKCNPSGWKKESKKKQTLSRRAMYGYRGNIRPARHPKPVNCAKKCRNKWHERISVARREAICNEYWSLANYER